MCSPPKRGMMTVPAAGVLLVLLILGCDNSAAPPGAPDSSVEVIPPGQSEIPLSAAEGLTTKLAFADQTERAGVEFTYQNGEEGAHFSIVESLGGGAALVDFDLDGSLDVFFPGGGQFSEAGPLEGRSGAMFRQRSRWSFQNVTDLAAISAAPWYSHGASAADFDNDGFPDLVITGYGGLVLFHNAGDGTLTRIDQSGLDDELWSSSAGWGDFNGDGVLDLYVAHYVNWSLSNDPFCPGPSAGLREICPPRQFEGLPDSLFAGQGDGTFVAVSESAGLQPDGKGLGVVVADINLDGHADVYVGNDTVPNFLYLSDGQGQLKEAGLSSAVSLSHQGTPDGSMGVDVGDYNRDGLPDIWVANYERESFALYRNEGGGFFRHISHSMGITAVQQLSVGWGTSFLDADRDGDEDLVASNGHVIRYPEQATLKQFPILFENRNGTRFINVASAAGGYFTIPHMGRGLATGDIDNDGDVDLVFVNTNEPARLLSNETENDHHWLGIRLISRSQNREAIGAHVILDPTGQNKQLRLIKSGGSYASTSDRRLFFGLGASEDPVALEVHWPGGRVQNLQNVAVDRWLDIIEPL